MVAVEYRGIHENTQAEGSGDEGLVTVQTTGLVLQKPM